MVENYIFLSTNTIAEIRILSVISERNFPLPRFDKFYRLQSPNSVAGTGLGLSIVRGIIEAHEGTVNAANQPGGGTIITIMIPVKTIKTGDKSER